MSTTNKSSFYTVINKKQYTIEKQNKDEID